MAILYYYSELIQNSVPNLTVYVKVRKNTLTGYHQLKQQIRTDYNKENNRSGSGRRSYSEVGNLVTAIPR